MYKRKKKYGKTGWSYPEKLYWCHGYSLGGEQAACLFCYQLKMLNILSLKIEIQVFQRFELLTMRSEFDHFVCLNSFFEKDDLCQLIAGSIERRSTGSRTRPLGFCNPQPYWLPTFTLAADCV